MNRRIKRPRTSGVREARPGEPSVEPRRHPALRWGLRLVGVAMLIVAAGATWSVISFLSPKPVALPLCPNPALWAHHRDAEGEVQAAFAAGYCGVEIDVQDVEGVGLVLSHDPVERKDLGDKPLTLARVLEEMPTLPGYIWLDFKNLRVGRVGAVAEELGALISRHYLEGRLVVESQRPITLRLLWHEVPTITPAYWISLPDTGTRRTFAKLKVAALAGALGLPALSVPKELLTDDVAAFFHRMTLFSWTCNSPEEVDAALARGARVVLTDADLHARFPALYGARSSGNAGGRPAASDPDRRSDGNPGRGSRTLPRWTPLGN